MLLIAALVPVMAGCAADARVAGSRAGSTQKQEELLTPWQTISSGRLVAHQDQNGFPLPGSIKGFAALIFPTALAVRAPDLYIADAGARKIYRFHPDLQAFSVVPGIDATTMTRLQVAPDQSLFVLDPARSVISRFSRGGQKLQMLSSPLSSAHLTEFMMGESLGRIYAIDQLNQQLIQLHPLGSAEMPLITAGGGEIKVLGALASVGRMVYAVDGGCACIAVIDEAGRVLERIGVGELIQPRALVADRYGRLFVADGFDRTLKVFMHGALIARYGPLKLHVTEISALAIDQGNLYIADGPGARVVAFRIRSP